MFPARDYNFPFSMFNSVLIREEGKPLNLGPDYKPDEKTLKRIAGIENLPVKTSLYLANLLGRDIAKIIKQFHDEEIKKNRLEHAIKFSPVMFKMIEERTLAQGQFIMRTRREKKELAKQYHKKANLSIERFFRVEDVTSMVKYRGMKSWLDDFGPTILKYKNANELYRNHRDIALLEPKIWLILVEAVDEVKKLLDIRHHHLLKKKEGKLGTYLTLPKGLVTTGRTFLQFTVSA